MYTVQELPGKGRGLVASKDIKAGTKILEDMPYAACLWQEYLEDKSYYSLHSSPALMRCAGCKFARYASTAEQKADWQDGHKFECKALQAVAPNYPDVDTRLIARALWKREIEESNNSNLEGEHSKGFAKLMALVDHWDSLPEGHKTAIPALATDVKSFMACAGKGSPVVDFLLIAKLVAKNFFNGFTTTDVECHSGSGIFTLGGLINHNCEPNCSQSFKGKLLVITAFKNIQAGEEITITYCKTALSKPERREMLLQRHHFDIYSEEERSNLQMNIKASQDISASGLLMKINFWGRAPCKMDDTDRGLVAVTRRSGDGCQQLQDSGFIAHELDFSILANNDFAKLHTNRKQEHTVDVWGPAFMKGDSIDWDEILGLVKYAAVCLRVIKMDQNNLGFEEIWATGVLSCKIEGKLWNQSSIQLGPHHALRQNVDMIRLSAGGRLMKYNETYPDSQRLRTSKVFLQSRNIQELWLMDKSMADFASMLGKKEDALVYAKNALKITLLLYPDQPADINRLKAIIFSNK